MKNIIKPKQNEQSECYSDFSGERFFGDIPEVEMKVSFNYGSSYDGANIEFHLSEQEAMEILLIIRNRLCDNTKNKIKTYLEKIEMDYDSAIQFREWGSCELYSSNIDMYRFLLNEKREVEEN
jgi:hypothetical protein